MIHLKINDLDLDIKDARFRQCENYLEQEIIIELLSTEENIISLKELLIKLEKERDENVRK